MPTKDESNADMDEGRLSAILDPENQTRQTRTLTKQSPTAAYQSQVDLKTRNTKFSKKTLNTVTSRSRFASSVNPLDRTDNIFKADTIDVSQDRQQKDKDAATVIAEALNTVRSTAGGALMRNSSMSNTIQPSNLMTQHFQDYVDNLHKKKKSLHVFEHEKLNKLHEKQMNQDSNIFTKM